MYPECLPPIPHYQFTNEEIFLDSLDFVHSYWGIDYSTGMHIQDFFEINIITRGSGMHYIEDQKLPAKRGNIFIIPPKVRHGYMGGTGFDVYHLLISDRFIEKYTADLQTMPSFYLLFRAEPLMRMSNSAPLYLALTDSQFQKIEELLREIDALGRPDTPFASIRCNSLSMLLITNLCEIYSNNMNSSENKDTQYDTAFMNALALIHERYYEKITITRLAKIAQLSRSSFIQRFLSVCKMPPSAYLTQRRIEAAEHMLANTGLSIAEIAEKTGFYDASHFVKTFSAKTGISPNLYRREHS